MLDALAEPGQQDHASSPTAEIKQAARGSQRVAARPQNRFAAELFANDPSLGLSDQRQRRADRRRANCPSPATPTSSRDRHPQDPKLAVGWVTADPVGAIAGPGPQAAPLRQVFLARLRGHGARQRRQGRVADDRLAADRQPAEEGHARRRWRPCRSAPPLAEPPAAYSAEKLLGHVTCLAAPEREGRGFGSAGPRSRRRLHQRPVRGRGPEARRRRRQLVPGLHRHRRRRQARSATLRNVIGVLPGADPAVQGRGGAAHGALRSPRLRLARRARRCRRQAAPGRRRQRQRRRRADRGGEGAGGRSAAAAHDRLRRLQRRGSRPARLALLREARDAGARSPASTATSTWTRSGASGDKPVSILATESAREWPFVFSGITAVTGVPTRNIPGASESSDQQAFIEAGVPGVQIFSGADARLPPAHRHRRQDGRRRAWSASRPSRPKRSSYLASTDKRLTVTARRARTRRAPRRRRTGRAASRSAPCPTSPSRAPGCGSTASCPARPPTRPACSAGDVLTHLAGERGQRSRRLQRAAEETQPGRQGRARAGPATERRQGDHRSWWRARPAPHAAMTDAAATGLGPVPQRSGSRRWTSPAAWPCSACC